MNKKSTSNSITISALDIKDSRKYFNSLKEIDNEARYFTGSLQEFSLNQIEDYIKKVVNNNSRRLFLITLNNEFIGEVALSDINDVSCHFRICIYKRENFSKGYGSFALEWIIDYAFNTLNLCEIELEVYPFNKRAIGLYKKFGFKESDRFFDKDATSPYNDIIIMKKENTNKG